MTLKKIDDRDSIPREYRDTPVARLIEYHNFQMPLREYDSAELLIGTCMDYRIRLRMPENFSYVLRTGGAHMNHSEFHISYAIAVAGIRHFALIGHSDCAMSGLEERRPAFIKGLAEIESWSEREARAHFNLSAPIYEIGDEEASTRAEAQWLQNKYPDILVVPMLYLVEDHRLYLIE